MATSRSSRQSLEVSPVPSPEEAAAITAALLLCLDEVQEPVVSGLLMDRWRLAARIESLGEVATAHRLSVGWRW